MPRILALGYNAWDVIVPWTGSRLRDEKNEIDLIYEGGGGPAATAAWVLAYLGMEVHLLTPLACDVPGLCQIAELAKAGVVLDLCPRYPDASSPRAVILTNPDHQSRTIFWSRGNLPDLAASALPPDILAGIDLLYCDGHEVDTALSLASEARRKGIPVVLDAGSVRPGSEALVELCTDVIASAEFAPALTRCQDLPEALSRMRALGPTRVGVTMGRYGVLGLDDAGLVARSAFEVEVIDTTGAGDVFHAGYTRALLAGAGFGQCLDWGNAAAAIKCQAWGGRGLLPKYESIQDLVSHGSRRPLTGPLAAWYTG